MNISHPELNEYVYIFIPISDDYEATLSNMDYIDIGLKTSEEYIELFHKFNKINSRFHRNKTLMALYRHITSSIVCCLPLFSYVEHAGSYFTHIFGNLGDSLRVLDKPPSIIPSHQLGSYKIYFFPETDNIISAIETIKLSG